MPRDRIQRMLCLALCASAPLTAQDALDSAKQVRELQPAIDKAIDRGVDWLLRQQLRDGSWGYKSELYVTGQTALALYTLMKSGLPTTHSSVRRGLLFLTQHRPIETYSTGCCLMALAAADDPAWHPKMQQLLDDLVTWQAGTWGYPFSERAGEWDTRHDSTRDLSNTQYAALGLKAASKRGLKVKDEVWIKLAEDTLRYQDKVEEVSLAAPPEERRKTKSAKQEAAGFRYRMLEGAATGSMTAAGVAILTLCHEHLGRRAPAELEQRMQRGIDLGMTWLATNLEFEKNPRSTGWLHYWLYGLERVCSFRGVELLGGRPWYLEGAKFLVAKQGGGGDWSDGYTSDPPTCFALLFLQRASAPVTGEVTRKKPGAHAGEGGKQDVDMRGQGGTDGSPLAMWISGFAPQALARLSGRDGAPVKGLRVAKVEYFCDGERVASYPGDPSRGWTTNDTFTASCEIKTRGKHRITAQVTVVDLDAAKGAVEPSEVIESKGFVVDARFVHEPWMDGAAQAHGRNVLRDATVYASASSTNSDGQKPERAVDQREGTAWFCKKDDTTPMFTMQPERALKADTLVLTQPVGNEQERGKHDVITKVRVRVNGAKTTIDAQLETDELQPSVIALGGVIAIKKLEIEIVERRKGTAWPGNAGFSEVALENRSKEKR